MDDLVPLKRIAARLGVSRTTLWRLSRTEACPAPVVLRRRVYWRAKDLDALAQALARYPGRGAFEGERRYAKARAVAKEAAASQRKQPSSMQRGAKALQPDLFGAPDAAAPGGAERR
jgi:predicted DNA-binding transcriptional regulator AlpA